MLTYFSRATKIHIWHLDNCSVCLIFTGGWEDSSQAVCCACAARLHSRDAIHAGQRKVQHWFGWNPRLAGTKEHIRVVMESVLPWWHVNITSKPVWAILMRYLVTCWAVFSCIELCLSETQDNCAKTAGMVTRFCLEMGWTDMAHLSSKFQGRINLGIKSELTEVREWKDEVMLCRQDKAPSALFFTEKEPVRYKASNLLNPNPKS
jgi:hypothetical protein